MRIRRRKTTTKRKGRKEEPITLGDDFLLGRPPVIHLKSDSPLPHLSPPPTWLLLLLLLSSILYQMYHDMILSHPHITAISSPSTTAASSPKSPFPPFLISSKKTLIPAITSSHPLPSSLIQILITIYSPPSPSHPPLAPPPSPRPFALFPDENLQASIHRLTSA